MKTGWGNAEGGGKASGGVKTGYVAFFCPPFWQCVVDSQLGPRPRFLPALAGKTEHT